MRKARVTEVAVILSFLAVLALLCSRMSFAPPLGRDWNHIVVHEAGPGSNNIIIDISDPSAMNACASFLSKSKWGDEHFCGPAAEYQLSCLSNGHSTQEISFGLGHGEPTGDVDGWMGLWMNFKGKSKYKVRDLSITDQNQLLKILGLTWSERDGLHPVGKPARVRAVAPFLDQ